MGRRVFVSALLLVIGSGLGFAACWFTRPAPAAATGQPAAGDEVVVEVRVKLPPGAVRPDDVHPPTRQGALLNTGEPMDLAVEGQGYFQVTLPSGEIAYTRDGAFVQNAQGSIVTKQGHSIVPNVTIPQDAVCVAIGSDGTITSCDPKGHASIIGQLTLARFPNPGGLYPTDKLGLWTETAASGPPSVSTPGAHSAGLIRQGFRERHPDLDAEMLLDLVRAKVREEHIRVRVEK